MDEIRNKGVKGLRWLEKYTKTDMVYLTHGGFWLGLGQIISSGSAFLTSIAFANLLAPETYGLYKYIISITSLVGITTLSGMDSAVTQAISRGYDGVLIPAVKTKIKWGAIGSLISLIIAGYYYSQGNVILTISFCIVSVFVPFSEAFDMYNSLLWGKKIFDKQTKYNSIRKILSLVAIISTLFLTKNLFIILLVYFSFLSIPAGLFFYKTIKEHLSNREIDGETLTYGKHLSLVNVIGLALGELDKILIFHYLGAVNLAIYALAVAPADQIKGLLKNVNSLAMPQFSNRTLAEIKKTIWHKIQILSLVTTLMVLVYVLFAPIFFDLFFPKYLASIHYSQVIAISLIPIVVAGFLYTSLESQKAKKELYQYNLFSNIINIIILLPLIYYFGIWGAVISRLIVRFITFVISIILVRNLKTI